MIFSPEDILLLSTSTFVLQQCASLNKALKNRSVKKSHKKLLKLSLTLSVLQFLYIYFAVLAHKRNSNNIIRCRYEDGYLLHDAPIYGWIFLNLTLLSIVEDLNRKYPIGTRSKATKALSILSMIALCLLAVINFLAYMYLGQNIKCKASDMNDLTR